MGDGLMFSSLDDGCDCVVCDEKRLREEEEERTYRRAHPQ